MRNYLFNSDIMRADACRGAPRCGLPVWKPARRGRFDLGRTGRYAPRRMRGSQAIAGLCLLGMSAVAAARPVVVAAPARGRPLEAGTVVEVSWSGLPGNAEEVELLLSLDGGRRVAVRLTEQLSPAGRSYFWRVPNISARRASLVLRMGIEGREIESAPSAPFEILPDASRPGQSVQWRDEELWLGEKGAARDTDPLPAAGLDCRPEQWAPLRDQSHSIAPASAAISGSRPSGRGIPVPCESSRGAPRPIPVSRLPLLAPLRI